MTRVSIITPSYNSAFFIAQTIESVQRQTFDDWEMQIVDDGSSDDTVALVRHYAAHDRRIKVHCLDVHRGPALCRNAAIEQARGRYIAFLDSDDMWAPTKLAEQLAFMNKQAAALSYTSYEKMSADGLRAGRVVEVPPSTSYARLLSVNVIGCLTAVYDTRAVGKVYMPDIAKRQDYGLWLRILKRGHLAYGLNEPLAFYRLRTDSLSSNKVSSARYTWRLYREVERLSLPRSLYHFSRYALSATRKSRI